MDNCRILCQVMADMKKIYDNLIILNLYSCHLEIDHLTQQPRETCQRTLRSKHCRHPGVVDHLGSLLLHVISPKTYASNNVKILQIFQCFGCIWRWSLVNVHFQHSKNPFVNLASFVYQLRAFVSDVGTYSSFNKGFEMEIHIIKS